MIDIKIKTPKERLPLKDIKYFAKQAGRAYVNDPVHTYANADKNKRIKFVYHFMMERLTTSNREDYIFTDSKNRGMIVWREAHNEYKFLDFAICPHWFFLYLNMPATIKTLLAYSKLDVKKFDKDTLIISPVFVDPDCQGQGIATELITRSMEELKPLGKKFGLEAQDEKNVNFYKKLGFEITGTDYYEKGNITHYYMVYKEKEEEK